MSRAARDPLRQALRGADPKGTGRLAVQTFRELAATHGLDLLQSGAAQAMRECLLGSQIDYENMVSLLAPLPSWRDSAAAIARPREEHAGSAAPSSALRRHGRSSSPLGVHGPVVRPVVRLVGLDKERARQVLLGLVPAGRSREALGLPHGLLTALRHLGVPDVFASAMRAEVESYGSTEVLIDDYLDFVTSFGSGTCGSSDTPTDRVDGRLHLGERQSRDPCSASCVAC